jgi:hypothetical protein
MCWSINVGIERTWEVCLCITHPWIERPPENRWNQNRLNVLFLNLMHATFHPIEADSRSDSVERNKLFVHYKQWVLERLSPEHKWFQNKDCVRTCSLGYQQAHKLWKSRQGIDKSICIDLKLLKKIRRLTVLNFQGMGSGEEPDTVTNASSRQVLFLQQLDERRRQQR